MNSKKKKDGKKEIELEDKKIKVETQTPPVNKGQKRCKRCHLFLNNSEWEQSKCVYHPGVFTPIGGTKWSSGWSCCNKELLNNASLTDFMIYQAPMQPLPTVPTVSEYLKEAARSAAEHYDEMMKNKQAIVLQNPNSLNQTSINNTAESIQMQTQTQTQTQTQPQPQTQPTVINIDASNYNLQSEFTYSISPVYEVSNNVVSNGKAIVSDINEEDEKNEIITPITPISVNINIETQPNYSVTLSQVPVQESASTPVNTSSSTSSTPFDRSSPSSPISIRSSDNSSNTERSTSPDCDIVNTHTTSTFNSNPNSIVSATNPGQSSSSSIIVSNNNIAPQHENPRYHSHTSIAISNGQVTVVNADPNANAIVVSYDQLTYVQKNQLLEQWDNQVVEYYVNKRHEKNEDKTMTLTEKMTHRDDPQLSPFSQESIGCTIVAHHLEDLEYSAAVSHFPIVENCEETHRPLPQEILEKKLGDKRNPLPDNLLTIEYKKSLIPETTSTQTPSTNTNTNANTNTNTPSSSIGDKSDESESESESSNDNETNDKDEEIKTNPNELEEKDKKIPDFFLHLIQSGDTLVGLSLKYGVPVDDLLRINYLNRSNLLQISHLKNLKIPTNGKSIPSQIIKKPSKQDIIQNFCRNTKSTVEEAKYYLEESEWNFDEAVEEYKKDKEWEYQNQGKFQGSKYLEPLPINRRPSDAEKTKNCLCVN